MKNLFKKQSDEVAEIEELGELNERRVRLGECGFGIYHGVCVALHVLW